MKRQITFNVYEVGIKNFVEAADGRFDLKLTPLAMMESGTATKGDIRAAILESGHECPRGTEVYAKKVGRVRYKFTTEALLSIAEEREELPLED